MRAVISFIILVVAACRSPAPADTKGTTPPDPPLAAEFTAAGDTIFAPFLGTWDEDAAACGESFSMTRFTVSPTGIHWFGGNGDVTAVRGDVDRIEVDLAYIPEGSATGEREPITAALSLDGSARLSLGLGGGRQGLIRCGSAAEPIDLPLPAEGGDLTVAVRFSPGTTSMTLSDTLRTFALHDYLVRAAGGQRLTASLRADGPGVPTLVVIREETYRGPQGDFEVLAPDEQERIDKGYGWIGSLPADGTYRVRVAHSGPAANGGVVSPYTLTVGVE